MGEHVYLSTACLHGGHDLCRRACKYCPAPCACDCHGAGERSQVTVELAPRADAELMDALRRALRSGRIVLRKPQPPDAQRRSEATPQIVFDLHDPLGHSRVDPYDTTKGFTDGS